MFQLGQLFQSSGDNLPHLARYPGTLSGHANLRNAKSTAACSYDNHLLPHHCFFLPEGKYTRLGQVQAVEETGASLVVVKSYVCRIENARVDSFGYTKCLSTLVSCLIELEALTQPKTFYLNLTHPDPWYSLSAENSGFA